MRAGLVEHVRGGEAAEGRELVGGVVGGGLPVDVLAPAGEEGVELDLAVVPVDRHGHAVGLRHLGEGARRDQGEGARDEDRGQTRERSATQRHEE